MPREVFQAINKNQSSLKENIIDQTCQEVLHILLVHPLFCVFDAVSLIAAFIYFFGFFFKLNLLGLFFLTS